MYKNPTDSPFEFIGFLNQSSNVFWVMTNLEIKLKEFKAKNPSIDTKEKDKMIEILRYQYAWLHALEKEYNTLHRVSLENNYNNLFLTNKIKELEEENEKLNARLDSKVF